MLYNTLSQLVDQWAALNVLRYITFRTGGALIPSLLISFICGPMIIRWLRKKQPGGQPIREDGPQDHLVTKVGTPTMGGFMILLAMILSTLMWADLRNGYIWAAVGVTVGYGVIGFIDDYLKVRQTASIVDFHEGKFLRIATSSYPSVNLYLGMGFS